MAQGVDGSWYAYIADGKKATGIDVKYAESLFGSGADYGTWCAPGTDLEYAPGTGTSGARSVSVPNLVASESRGVSIPYLTHIGVGNSTFSGYSQGTGITAVCDTAATDGVNRMGDDLYNSQKMSFNATSPAHVLNAGATGINNTDNAMNNVVREARALSNGTGDYYGNIGLGPNFWPLIQLYDFTRYQSYDLVYERGGADETIALTYDRPAGYDADGNKIKGLVFDKDFYGLKHEVGVTLYNNELNIDPTDEDSWTFGTLPTNATIFYQLFDENGANDSAANGVKFDSFTGSSTWGFNDGGIMKIDINGPEDASNDVLYFQGNSDQNVECSGGICSSADINLADQAVTFTETGSNTGTFTNWDNSLKTNMYINEAADRGTQATFWPGTGYRKFI
jgi:hypothetical protein